MIYLLQKGGNDMASLHGFSLKKVVNYKGHEGEPLSQADIYYRGKQIGFWRMGDFGGEDEFYGIDSHFLPKEYFDYIRNVWGDTFDSQFPNMNTRFSDEMVASSFFAELLYLHEMEKELKKIMKKGFQALITVSISFYSTSFNIPVGYDLERAKIAVEKQFDKLYPKWTEHPKTIKVYNDLSQFTVG